MSVLPNIIAQLTAYLIFFNFSYNINAKNHSQRNISYTEIMRTNEFEKNNKVLGNCMVDVLQTSDNTYRGGVLIRYYSINVTLRSILGDLVERVLQNDVIITKYFPNSQIENVQSSLRLLFVDSYDSLIKLLAGHSYSPEIQSYRKYFVVILMVPDYSTIAPINEMEKIFKLCYNISAVDVNVMVATSEKVNIYTFYPYTYRHCGSTRPVLLDSCSEKTTYSFCRTSLFPPKNRNMNLCPFKVLAAHLPPFFILKNPYVGEESFTGIDGEILKLISRKLNFTIVLSDRSGGTFNDIAASSGASNLLNQPQAVPTIGYSECTSNTFRFLASSNPYHQNSLHVLLKDSEGYSSLEAVFFPFSTPAWIIVLIVNILRIILSLLKRYQFYYRLHRAIPKMLYIAWCFITLIFCASYGSLFFTLMLHQPSKPLPRSFDELREQSYKIFTDVIHATLAQNISELQGLLIITSKTAHQILIEFEKLSSHRVGILTNMETFSYYIKNEFKNPDIYVNLDERLRDVLYCMYFPHLSHFTNEFNERIAQLHAFGLPLQIVSKFSNPIHLPNTKAYRTYHGNDAGSSDILSLYHLKGPFIIFLGCQAIACIAFVLEIISLKLWVLKKGFAFLQNK